jgi:hypothetical protein
VNDHPADPLDHGIALFNDRQFFEAHEVWEESWRRAMGDEARFLQGLIQVAAGFVKWQRGQARGQANLFAKGAEKLAPFRAGRHGVDVAALLDTLAAWRAAPDGPPPDIRRSRP